MDSNFESINFNFLVPNWTPTSTRATKAESEIVLCQNRRRSRWKKPKLFLWECWSLSQSWNLNQTISTFVILGKWQPTLQNLYEEKKATILLGSPVVNHLPAHVQKWLESPVRYDNYSEARLLVALDPITELSTHVIDCKFKKFFILYKMSLNPQVICFSFSL